MIFFKNKKKILIFAKYIIPLVLIGWMVAINPWEDFYKRLVNVPVFPILLAIGINFGLIFPFKVLRWRIVIPRPPSFWTIYASQLEGQLANILVGVGVADVVRSLRLRKEEKGTFPEDFGTAMADRICEYLALSILLAISTLTPFVSAGWIIVPILYCGIVVLILLMPDIVRDKLKSWPKVFQTVIVLGKSLSVKRMTLMILMAFIGWLSETFMIFIILSALKLPSSLGLAAMILFVINVAIAIPGPPANLGTFEAGAIIALTSVGIGKEAAFAFALFYHGFHIISTSVVASIVWLLRNYVQSKN